MAVELARGWVAPRSGRRVVCTHLGGICTRNDADDTWDCPLHGSRFESDGTVLAAPATRPVRLEGSDAG